MPAYTDASTRLTSPRAVTSSRKPPSGSSGASGGDLPAAADPDGAHALRLAARDDRQLGARTR